MAYERKLKTLTVKALRDLLEGEDDDALVIFSTDYGDYHHTPQALPLRGETEEVYVEKSGYSNSGFAVVSDEDDAAELMEEDDAPRYLLIR